MRHLAASAVLVSTLLIGCADSVDNRTRLSIFAASSLTDAFQELASEFEAQNPDVALELAFAGSQILSLQIEQGGPFDLFASADEGHVQRLVDGGYVHPPQIIAATDLVLVIPTDNPAGLETFQDLPKASRIVVGNEFAPIGSYTHEILERATAELGASFGSAVRRRITSMESNVRLVRAKVELGEADAALVYRPDALSSSRVLAIPIPEVWNVSARFPVAISTQTDHETEAARFLRFLASPKARETLREHGFVRTS